jgi:thiol:disulfide interchange protein DsbD
MDKNLFHNRPAQMQDWQLVRLDITETSADSKAILARYQLFGPPALLYYQEGQLVNQQVGEIGRLEFEQTLTRLN